ncbi:MAG TPA: hypothetical protein VE177_08425 [Candidatus Binatus sp.]|nr:hypothetical protein [Candidatus Binatus sp.]
MDRTEGALVVALIAIVALGGLFIGRTVYGANTQGSQNEIVVLAKDQAFTTDANGKATMSLNVPATDFKDSLGALVGNMNTGSSDASQVTVAVIGTVGGSYCNDTPSSCVTVPLGGGNGQLSTFTGTGSIVQFGGVLPTAMNMVTVHVSVNCGTTTCANVGMSFTLLLVGKGN